MAKSLLVGVIDWKLRLSLVYLGRRSRWRCRHAVEITEGRPMPCISCGRSYKSKASRERAERYCSVHNDLRLSVAQMRRDSAIPYVPKQERKREAHKHVMQTGSHD